MIPSGSPPAAFRTRRFLPAVGAALIALIALPAHAEHRVALLITDAGTPSPATGLEQHGFRCESSANLPQKELQRRIESWASRTPTNSTALLYFAGKVRQENDNGAPAVGLIARDDRPLPIQAVLESLCEKGGSRLNLLIADGPDLPGFSEDLPPGCFVTLGNLPALDGNGDLLAKLRTNPAASTLPQDAAITGQGARAISPPDHFVPGRRAGDEWINARGMIFCWCPPGTCLAGSPEDTPGRYPDEQQHQVVVNDGFWIAKYELTRGQSLRNLSPRSIGTHKNHPLEMLHWDDARSSLKRFTEEERNAGRLPAGWQYDLPTEQQWEYAARAGTTTRFYFGEDINALPQHANFADKSYYDSGDIYSNAAHRTLDDRFVTLAPVGSFAPNPWGLHDVCGNVAEWCRDHGARGGGWVSIPDNCRSAYRDHYSSRNEQNHLGYRLVIQPNAPELKQDHIP